jgi:hypothetical protein
MGRSATQVATKAGGFLVDGSHICYPNPLTSSPLHVRAEATQNGQARVSIYNLEGEQVATAGPQTVFGGEPFELVLPFDNLAGGMYLCRLVLECDCGGSQTSVITFGAAK